MATALASVGLFIGALWAFGIIRVAAGVLVIAKGALATIRNESIDDEAREKAAQRASIRLMSAFVSIFVRSTLALLVSFLPILLADSTGLAETEDVFRYLSRWDVIAILSVVTLAGYILWRWLWPFK